MLSKEFLIEAPPVNPVTGDPYTPAERDAEYAKNQAQGQKNLQGLKDFGNKLLGRAPAPAPAPAPAATAHNPEADLDPAIMKARYDQEAAARKAAPADAAPPPPGGEARPVPSSIITPTELPPMPVKSFAEPAGTAPAPMKGGYGSGMNNPSVAPKTAAAPATDAAAQYAAADAGRVAVKSTETNPELERMKTNAGISSTADAKSDIKGAPSFAGQTDEFGGMESPPTATAPRTEKAINPETGQEYDKLATAQSANDGDAGEELAKIKANAGLAQSANDGDAGEAQAAAGGAPAANPMSQDPAQRAQAAAAAPEAPAAAPEAPVKAFAEPPAAPAAPATPAAPAAPAAAKLPTRPGQQTSGPATRTAAKSDPAVLKQQQDLIAKGAKIKADGIMGPATQAAIKQFAAAPVAGGGRGVVSPTAADTAAAVAAAKPAVPAKPAAVAATKPAAAPAAKLPAPQTGAAGQAARAASGKAPTPVSTRQSTAAVMESQEINRMRFLAGLSKD
jgi:hypothetical protein